MCPAALTQASMSGNITVTCNGAFAVGAQPVITLQVKVNKMDCSYQPTADATATSNKLLCCTTNTSYAALIDPVTGARLRKLCFRPS